MKSNCFFKSVIMVVVFTFVLVSVNAHAECEEGQECPPEASSPAAASIDATATDVQVPVVDVPKERIKALWLSGLISFSTVYLSTVIVTTALSESSVRGKAAGYTLIPMAGPFILVGNSNDDIDVSGYAGALITAGVLQILTAALFTTGLIVKRPVKSDDNKTALNRPSWFITPAPIGNHGAGAVFTLTHF